MIVVEIGEDHVQLKGHAKYDIVGRDIICAGVSALVFSLIHSLRDLTDDEIECSVSEGNVFIKYENLSEQGKLLVDSFFIGITDMMETYPDYIKLSS
ncbi:MAG: ribosomal-processing cysteine protease Prp [Collinsella tanakaei]|nr:MAG: ribosomal-processing cysteine protease Prp [Collinsella tanakaei]